MFATMKDLTTEYAEVSVAAASALAIVEKWRNHLDLSNNKTNNNKSIICVWFLSHKCTRVKWTYVFILLSMFLLLSDQRNVMWDKKLFPIHLTTSIMKVFFKVTNSASPSKFHVAKAATHISNPTKEAKPQTISFQEICNIQAIHEQRDTLLNLFFFFLFFP